jgi:hypothetical protein
MIVSSTSLLYATDIADFTLPYPTWPAGTKNPPANLTDIHIIVEANGTKFTIIGVNGIGPQDPNAHYGVIGQGGTGPQIININPVSRGGTITIRVQADSGFPQENNKDPKTKRLKYEWSYAAPPATAGGATVPNTIIEAPFTMRPDGL